MRYTFLPSANIILCSTYQQEEITYYLKNEWIVCEKVELWGLEEASELDKINSSIKFMTLLFFQARSGPEMNSIGAEKDIEKIKSLKPTQLFIYKIFDEMVLDAVLN